MDLLPPSVPVLGETGWGLKASSKGGRDEGHDRGTVTGGSGHSGKERVVQGGPQVASECGRPGADRQRLGWGFGAPRLVKR